MYLNQRFAVVKGNTSKSNLDRLRTKIEQFGRKPLLFALWISIGSRDSRS
jgi:hypothetical protein